ncbi:hypothetical protein SKAU_G00092180 [Synaphobranchus kaupii]|uniref:Uncharacterized protein n=1 Tax=Synaphobranchus kaupii TaxID=118154 RepID=A0A9Q1FXS0_SYNKA|nr:hypothetical protein SKAU_G00092180 [Synaphobranchus kaupii]
MAYIQGRSAETSQGDRRERRLPYGARPPWGIRKPARAAVRVLRPVSAQFCRPSPQRVWRGPHSLFRSPWAAVEEFNAEHDGSLRSRLRPETRRHVYVLRTYESWAKAQARGAAAATSTRRQG